MHNQDMIIGEPVNLEMLYSLKVYFFEILGRLFSVIYTGDTGSQDSFNSVPLR